MQPLNTYCNKCKLGDIIFELDESSIELLYDDFKQFITEGNRVIYNDKISTLRIGDHATQREDRPVDRGGDGKHIDEQEIIIMFKYAWDDILDMYYNGLLNTKYINSFTIQCKCYLKEHGKDIVPDGARPDDKCLWAAWMINENYNTGKIDIIIRTIYRGETFYHGKNQERIVIAYNGYIKQKY